MINVNKIQKQMVEDVRNELTPLPKSHHELASLLIQVILSVDHESNEEEFMIRCKVKMAKTYFSIVKDDKGVYLSQIKNQLVRLNYFQTLDNMAKARNEDGFRIVYRSFVKDGMGTADGNKIILNENARTFMIKNTTY